MKEVLGCGIDIEELSRFGTKIPTLSENTHFSDLVYTPSEVECNLDICPGVTFPLCFSCKEAFFKALGVSWTNSAISWKDIELLFHNKDNLNEYSIRLNGFARELFNEKKCQTIESYLEYNNTYVIFQVILLS
jgi:phosphopantetheine--protein transferase-like protein